MPLIYDWRGQNGERFRRSDAKNETMERKKQKKPCIILNRRMGNARKISIILGRV